MKVVRVQVDLLCPDAARGHLGSWGLDPKPPETGLEKIAATADDQRKPDVEKALWAAVQNYPTWEAVPPTMQVKEYRQPENGEEGHPGWYALSARRMTAAEWLTLAMRRHMEGDHWANDEDADGHWDDGLMHLDDLLGMIHEGRGVGEEVTSEVHRLPKPQDWFGDDDERIENALFQLAQTFISLAAYYADKTAKAEEEEDNG
jgi:hypothetical protein